MGWLFFDKIFRLGAGLVLGVLITRYLGPVNYGRWNYAIALVALLSVFATLGLDSIIVKELINKPEKGREILGTSFFMRIIGSTLIILVGCLIVFFTNEGKKDYQMLEIVFLTALGYIFLSFDVIDFYFQSRVESKYTVRAKFAAFLILCIVRFLAFLYHLPLLAFVFLALLEIVLAACFLIYLYIRKTGYNPFQWSVNFKFMRQTLKEAWPLILSGMVIMIYMRIDQIMLRQLSGEKAVGVYSVAVNLSEIWYMIPMIATSSIYPSLLELKLSDEIGYKKRFDLVYRAFFVIPLVISISTMLLSGSIIGLLYGPAYHESANILRINIWAGIFVFLGVGSSYYMVIENLTKISLYKTALGAMSNILLNFILIPSFRGDGAAIATLISYAIAGYFSNLLFRQTRPLFYDMTYSIFNFWRISEYKK